MQDLMLCAIMSRNEMECESAFRRMGQVFNANTPENHPVIFKTESDFKSAMSILAICVKIHPGIKVYAFQIMSNHIHLVVGGSEGAIRLFFSFFVSRLNKFFRGEVSLDGFTLKLFPVSDMAYFRNAVSYVNRNGFVVNNDVTPFSYPWGSSRYFFQPLALSYHELTGRTIGITALRTIIHSRTCDNLKDMKIVDGYISPLEYCHIKEAENVFRDAKQYFYAISRNVETYSEVAKSIGESIFYTDTDMYNVALKMAKEHFGRHDLRTLPAEAKIEIAKRLHYDYNAGDKQIQRLLSIEAYVMKALF